MGCYRYVLHTDETALLEHLLRLDADTRCARFYAVTSDSTLRRYVASIDWNRVRIIGYFDHEGLRAVAEIRLSRLFLPNEAELAFTVEPAYQNGRIGSKLMTKALTYLRNRGVSTAQIVCMLNNGRMQKLALRHRANVQASSGEVFLTIRVPLPDLTSVAQELTEEYFGWLATVLAWTFRPVKVGLDALPDRTRPSLS